MFEMENIAPSDGYYFFKRQNIQAAQLWNTYPYFIPKSSIMETSLPPVSTNHPKCHAMRI